MIVSMQSTEHYSFHIYAVQQCLVFEEKECTLKEFMLYLIQSIKFYAFILCSFNI